MATKEAIAIQREKAMKRIETAKPEIEQLLGIEAAEIPFHRHDRDLLHAEQLTAIADTFDRVLVALKPT